MTFAMIAIHFWSSRKEPDLSRIEIIALYFIGMTGWFTISNAIFGHIIYADQVAESIGWPLNRGFQTELAFALIGMGILGAVGMWRPQFWLPFIIAKTSMMWGAAGTHIVHQIQQDNFSPNNTGIVVIWDIVLPFALAWVYYLYQKEQKKKSGK